MNIFKGDGNGHIGLGVKAAKEVATAIRGGIINAKMNLVPVRRGYWGLKAGLPHTVPCKVSGKYLFSLFSTMFTLTLNIYKANAVPFDADSSQLLVDPVLWPL